MGKGRRIPTDQRGFFDPPATVPVTQSLCGDTGITLRDYQQAMMDGCWDRFIIDREPSVLVVAATGLGKTVAAAFMGRRWIESIHHSLGLSRRVLFLANREELITQATGTFRAVNPALVIEVEQAEKHTRLYSDRTGPATVVIGSVATMSLSQRLERFDPDYFGLVIIDEAHHYALKNNSYRCIVERFKTAKLIGLTATPDRGDEIALGQTFASALDCPYDMQWGIENGWLVPIKAKRVLVEGLDLDEVQLDKEDFTDASLAQRMKQEKALVGLVMPTIDMANQKGAWYVGRRQALVFAASVEHASLMADLFNREHAARKTGIAAVVYSQAKGMPPMDKAERRAIIQAYRNGEITYLCNYGVLTEGFDAPETKIVTIGRPTTKRALYAQMVGRGSRPWPGLVEELAVTPCPEERRGLIAISEKPCMLIVDPIGISGRHKLITAADVLGGRYDESVQQVANATFRNSSGIVDIDTVLRDAARQRQEEVRRKLRNARYKVTYTTREMDPFDVLDITVCREPIWFKGKMATEAQRGVLKRSGFTDDQLGKMTFTQASQAIEGIVKRREQGKCTLAQARILHRYGHSTDTSFEEAGRILNDLASKGWPEPAVFEDSHERGDGGSDIGE